MGLIENKNFKKEAIVHEIYFRKLNSKLPTFKTTSDYCFNIYKITK